MSIDPRLKVADNIGASPCIPPLLLGCLMDRVCDDKPPTLRARVTKALANLRRRLAQ